MKTAPTKAVTEQAPGTPDGVLVDPAWLERHLHDPAVRVVEVDVSPAAYDDGHIEGAVLWNVYADLKDADYQTRRRHGGAAAGYPVGNPARTRRSCSTATHPRWGSGS